MNALQGMKIKKALFISPVVDMEKLIIDMMEWANVSEKELFSKREIITEFGEKLSWGYLEYVRNNPIKWTTFTEILYAEKDNLISRETIDIFVKSHNANLIVMENGEHWFHTGEQLEFLDQWVKNTIRCSGGK